MVSNTHTGTQRERGRNTGTHTHRQTHTQMHSVRTASFLSSSSEMMSTSWYSRMNDPCLLSLACSSAIAFSASTRRYSWGNTCNKMSDGLPNFTLISSRVWAKMAPKVKKWNSTNCPYGAGALHDSYKINRVYALFSLYNSAEFGFFSWIYNKTVNNLLTNFPWSRQ